MELVGTDESVSVSPHPVFQTGRVGRLLPALQRTRALEAM